MSFMVLNLLISVILVAFSNEQIYHKVNIYILFNWGTDNAVGLVTPVTPISCWSVSVPFIIDFKVDFF